MVPKTWGFERGGRPVIYQTEEEYHNLPESLRWRHVRFDPLNGIDFTWEREWRIRIDELVLDISVAVVIVPDSDWEQRIRRDHEYDQALKVAQYALFMDEQVAHMYCENFPWTLKQSGRVG
jgi:hypothetical protein